MDLIRLEEIMKKHQPDSIFYDEDGWTATTEWLIGTFAGVGFTNETIEESIKEMCEYLTKHINHQSVVGNIVTKSGFPDLDKVEKYLNTEEMESMFKI